MRDFSYTVYYGIKTTDTYSFTSPPSNGLATNEDDEIIIGLLSDNQNEPKTFTKLLNVLSLHNPRMILHIGDIVQVFFFPFKVLSSQLRFKRKSYYCFTFRQEILLNSRAVFEYRKKVALFYYCATTKPRKNTPPLSLVEFVTHSTIRPTLVSKIIK